MSVVKANLFYSNVVCVSNLQCVPYLQTWHSAVYTMHTQSHGFKSGLPIVVCECRLTLLPYQAQRVCSACTTSAVEWTLNPWLHTELITGGCAEFKCCLTQLCIVSQHRITIVKRSHPSHTHVLVHTPVCVCLCGCVTHLTQVMLYTCSTLTNACL